MQNCRYFLTFLYDIAQNRDDMTRLFRMFKTEPSLYLNFSFLGFIKIKTKISRHLGLYLTGSTWKLLTPFRVPLSMCKINFYLHRGLDTKYLSAGQPLLPTPLQTPIHSPHVCASSREVMPVCTNQMSIIGKP